MIKVYDIFCVSETHLHFSDIVDIPGYTFISKHRTQNYKRKSGGIGIFVNNKLYPFIDILDNDSEYVLWISIKKPFLSLDEPIVLGAIYLPPENSRFINDDLLVTFENKISEKCSKHKYVFLTGDTNARTGRLRDYIPIDSYISDYFDIDEDSHAYFNKCSILENLGIMLERCSCDSKTNTHGIRLIDTCRNNNLLY